MYLTFIFFQCAVRTKISCSDVNIEPLMQQTLYLATTVGKNDKDQQKPVVNNKEHVTTPVSNSSRRL